MAAFERLPLPEAIDAGGGGARANGIATPPIQLGADQVANVTVEYTSYRRGRRVALVQEIGLKRGGPNGFWFGLVDQEGLDRLIQAFPKKVKINAIHSEIIPSSAGVLQQSKAACEKSVETTGTAAEDVSEALAEPREKARPIMPPHPVAAAIVDFATTRCAERDGEWRR